MERVTIDNVCYELDAKNRTTVIVKGKYEGDVVIPETLRIIIVQTLSRVLLNEQ